MTYKREQQKVLIVDDSHETVELFSEVLSIHDFKVATASDGEECLKEMERFHPDLILLDIMMPKMDGWEVIRELEERRCEERPRVAILSVKSHFEKDMKRLAENPGYHFMEKPVTTAELLKGIRDVLQGPIG